ncbi:GFA family protein [Notoacmeibacter ruber]|uniref:GFA family protein n=1 Tax=Notoacmeibacter ruber TaxID=2670375 RepID=A0A3L7JB47_9HYPH|nr:GFA family protein [Notoacmeibacter ruber]RLQ87605.1 GFA family protein [Notoacmeibacter ruber]
MTITGGCQSGAVRYRVEGAFGDPHLCHCRMCQKASGNYFQPFGLVQHRNFALVTGEPKWFASSEPARRGFCGECGTPLFFELLGKGRIGVSLGSLDDPASVKPVSAYGAESRVPFIAEVCAIEGEPYDTESPTIASVAATNRQKSGQERRE